MRMNNEDRLQSVAGAHDQWRECVCKILATISVWAWKSMLGIVMGFDCANMRGPL